MTSTDLLDLRGVAQRATSYRFDLLDNRHRVIGEVHPSRDTTPTITHDPSRVAARDMASFNLVPAEAADVNVLTDRVRPVMILENGEQYPLGIFLFADASNPVYSYGTTLTASLVDQGLILDQAFERTTAVPRESDVRSTIIDLLEDVGVTHIVDSAPLATTTTGEPMAWAAGQTRATVIGDLCRIAGLNPPWFDHDGVCRITRVVDPETSEADVDYTNGQNIYAQTPVYVNDLLRTVNRVIAISSDSANVAHVGIYDVPAGAPHSFYARGFRIPEVINLQGIGSQAQIDAAAKAHATTGARKGTFVEHISFSGPPDPRHDGYSIVSYNGENWLEESWSLPFTAFGPMTHTLRRSVV